MEIIHAKVIALFDEARATIRANPQLGFQQTPQFTELCRLCSSKDKFEAMQGVMLYLRDKVSPLPEILIKKVASFFSFDLPQIPESHEGRLSKTNEDYLVWGLANGLYPIEKDKISFKDDLSKYASPNMTNKKFLGTVCTHFKKPILIWLCLDSLDSNEEIEILALMILSRCVGQEPYSEECVPTTYARDCWLRWGYEEGYLLHNSYPEEYEDLEE